MIFHKVSSGKGRGDNGPMFFNTVFSVLLECIEMLKDVLTLVPLHRSPFSCCNSYVHRIGRTGRAGRPGEAITFFTESDMTMLRSIANVMKLSGCHVPDWMLSMKKLRHSDRKRLAKIPVKRMNISTTSHYDKRKRNNIREATKSSKRAKQNGQTWKNKTERKRETRQNKTDDGDGGGWTVVE